MAFLSVCPAAHVGTPLWRSAAPTGRPTTVVALPTRRRPARRAAAGPSMATPTPTKAPSTPDTIPPPPPGGDGDGDGGGGGGNVDAKALVAQYGGAYIATSLSLAAISFGLWYAAVANGVNVLALVGRLGDALAATPIGRPAALDRLDPGLSTAALAYVAHKVSSPLRFPLTVALTPVVARVFKRGKGKDAEQ
ncbi:hypothetical protein MMPV_005969 [Pyropia vietnamensis]